MNNLRQRIARLEADGEPGTVYFISDEPEGEAPAAGSYAIGRELTAEEWAQAHCDGKGRYR
jgi:hypothetical protein